GRGSRGRWGVRRILAWVGAGGRFGGVFFFRGAAGGGGGGALEAPSPRRALFDDDKAAFLGVSIDPADEAQRRVTTKLPGYRYFLGSDGKVSKLYGALPVEAQAADAGARQLWVVLDPTLRILKGIPFTQDRRANEEGVPHPHAP